MHTPYEYNTPERFYQALWAAVSCITGPLQPPPCILLQLRKLTSSVFVEDPDSWMMEDFEQLNQRLHEISTEALKKYHLSSLTQALKETLMSFAVDEALLATIAHKSYEANRISPNCPNEIKATFLEISKILAVGAYRYRTQNASPLKLFLEQCFAPEVSALITLLFELTDKIEDSEDLNILGSIYSLTGLHLDDVQKEFTTRWVNTVLSPSGVDVKILKPYEKDEFNLIPVVVKRAEDLWDEYMRHVFGKTVSVIFNRIDVAAQAPNAE